jgi:two-component system sensor histidine kinase RegB
MVNSQTGFQALEAGTNWVRLRTLILLRWTAIAGQVAATLVATQVYGVKLPLGLCALAIGSSIIANLALVMLFPENRRLNEGEAFLTLLFDLTQLSCLILATGGLTNPFAILVLAPVTISASVLRLRSTVVLAAVAILFVTAALFWYLPLRFVDGSVLVVPWLFLFGFWLAIVIGVLFLGLYSRRVATEMRSMSEALLATQMALAREQKLTDLAGVVAAAAHELGTPLATIKLVSAELIDELDALPDLQADARLIREQADRCRDILRDMGRAGKDDLHLRQAPLGAVLREAAEPHLARGKDVRFEIAAGPRRGRSADDLSPPRDHPRPAQSGAERGGLCTINRLDQRRMDSAADHRADHRQWRGLSGQRHRPDRRPLCPRPPPGRRSQPATRL